jgi:hypothetical protein
MNWLDPSPCAFYLTSHHVQHHFRITLIPSYQTFTFTNDPTAARPGVQRQWCKHQMPAFEPASPTITHIMLEFWRCCLVELKAQTIALSILDQTITLPAKVVCNAVCNTSLRTSPIP